MKILNLFPIALCLAATSLSAADQPAQKKPAQPKPELPTYLTVETAGPDYADQGEYSNDWGGAQVIALGNDTFRLVIYPGGLPGAGWEPIAARQEASPSAKTTLEGKREGDKIVFATAANGFKHHLASGVLHTLTPNGDEYTMKKIQRASPALGAKPPAGAIVLYD